MRNFECKDPDSQASISFGVLHSGCFLSSFLGVSALRDLLERSPVVGETKRLLVSFSDSSGFGNTVLLGEIGLTGVISIFLLYRAHSSQLQLRSPIDSRVGENTPSFSTGLTLHLSSSPASLSLVLDRLVLGFFLGDLALGRSFLDF